MAFSHGSNAVFKIDDSGGTLTDISSYVTSVSFPESADTAEVTTLGKSSKVYIAGLKDATISIEGVYDPTVDSLLNGILGASSTSSFEYGPAGSSTGSPKYTGECICTSYEVTTGVDGAATFSAEFQVSDSITRGTY
ncbi:MAG: hypothetical protein GXP39_07915 [Chloroflexi bacterium]|nr:hypothetical protein [Chloroflexota bacterium]